MISIAKQLVKLVDLSIPVSFPHHFLEVPLSVKNFCLKDHDELPISLQYTTIFELLSEFLHAHTFLIKELQGSTSVEAARKLLIDTIPEEVVTDVDLQIHQDVVLSEVKKYAAQYV